MLKFSMKKKKHIGYKIKHAIFASYPPFKCIFNNVSAVMRDIRMIRLVDCAETNGRNY
jgi:hypothetical protein